MNEELKTQCYELMLTKPTWSDPKIAKTLNVSRGLVYRTRRSLLLTIDYELAKKFAGKFLVDFQMASDYFKLQIERLDFLKTKTNTVVLKDGSTINVELSPMEYLSIEKQQTDLWVKLLEFARQGEVIEVMRLIQNGKIQPLTN